MNDHHPDELTCRKMVELITAYLEGALSEDDRALFDEHLRKCDGCDGYLEQMRTTIVMVGRLNTESVPPDVRRRLLHAFRGWKRGGGEIPSA